MEPTVNQIEEEFSEISLDSDLILSSEESKTPEKVDAGSKVFEKFGIQVSFPFDTHPVQLEFATKVLYACKWAKNAILESPAGTKRKQILIHSLMAWLKTQKGK